MIEIEEVATYTPSAMAANDLYKRQLDVIKTMANNARLQRETTTVAIHNSLSIPKNGNSPYTTLRQTKMVNRICLIHSTYKRMPQRQ